MSKFIEEYKVLAIPMVMAALYIAIVVSFSFASCNAKTADMGFAHRWSVLGGCQIEVTSNQWIPLDSYYFKQE